MIGTCSKSRSTLKEHIKNVLLPISKKLLILVSSAPSHLAYEDLKQIFGILYYYSIPINTSA